MSALILTNLSKGKHKFNLEYIGEGSNKRCYVVCKCGYRHEILYFRNYAGVKEVQRVWEEHTS